MRFSDPEINLTDLGIIGFTDCSLSYLITVYESNNRSYYFYVKVCNQPCLS